LGLRCYVLRSDDRIMMSAAEPLHSVSTRPTRDIHVHEMTARKRAFAA
jgi:hypothetical protein